MVKEFDFLNFVKNNESKILDVIERCSQRLPSVLKELDNRFALGSYFPSMLIDQLGFPLTLTESIGYDMLYEKRVRLSVKSQAEIFQRQKKDGTLTLPNPIVMVNSLKKSQENKSVKYEFSNFEYLLVIQRGQESRNKHIIGFGIISRENLNKFIMLHNNDQIKVRIPNDGYEFISLRKSSLIWDAEKDNRLNKIVLQKKYEMYKEMFNFSFSRKSLTNLHGGVNITITKFE
jgi:hypothetical protein